MEEAIGWGIIGGGVVSFVVLVRVLRMLESIEKNLKEINLKMK